MKFQKISFEDACPTISFTFYLSSLGLRDTGKILIIKFDGEYREGSIGNPDAALMAGIIKIAVEIWRPKAVIIDLSSLEYVWGDEIERIYDTRASKTAIVVGPKCHEVLSTLEFGLDSEHDITELENFFDTLEAAIAYTEDKK